MDTAPETDALVPEPPGGERYLTFLLGTERFAMSAGSMRQIIRFSSLTDVPLMPDFLLGVMHVRGNVVPVIDLALRLGLEKTVFGKYTCVVIMDLQYEEQSVCLGVLVDMVQAACFLDPDRLEPLPPGHPDMPAGFVQGALHEGAETLIVLDVNRVLAPDELGVLIGAAGFSRDVVLPREAPGDAL